MTNKTNRKLIAVALALAMLVSVFTACGKRVDNNPNESNTSETTSNTEAETEIITITETVTVLDEEGNVQLDDEGNPITEVVTVTQVVDKNTGEPVSETTTKKNNDSPSNSATEAKTTTTTSTTTKKAETTTKKSETTTKAPTTTTDSSAKEVPYTITKVITVNGKPTSKEFTIVKAYTANGCKYEVASDGSLFIDGKYVRGVNVGEGYLTYEEVKECVAEAEAYAISLGFKIDRNNTIYNSSYAPGADTSAIVDDKEFFIQYLKEDIDFRYQRVIDDFGYFITGAAINIYIAGPDDLHSKNMEGQNPDSSPRYIAYVCV